jgi:hypothetical protein
VELGWAGGQRLRGLGASERFGVLLARFDSTAGLEGLSCEVYALQLLGFGSVISVLLWLG